VWAIFDLKIKNGFSLFKREKNKRVMNLRKSRTSEEPNQKESEKILEIMEIKGKSFCKISRFEFFWIEESIDFTRNLS